MAKNNGQNKSGNKLFNTIVAVVMVIVIGISVYAIYTTASTKILDNQIATGEKEATLEYMAKTEGISVDEFLEKENK